MNINKVIVFFMFFCSTIVVAQHKDFVGTYFYTEMEYAEQLHILESNRFSWQQVYGAVNKDLRGKWNRKGDTLHLVLDAVPGNERSAEFEAIFTSSGNLNFTKFNGKIIEQQKNLKPYNKDLSEEMAKKLAQPIDYSKVIASRKSQLERQKEKEQKRFEKFNKERKDLGKYHGFFKSDDLDAPIVLGMNAKRKQFVFEKPAAEKGKVDHLQGTFTVKNDTAYATTAADQDKIKLYGSQSDNLAEDELVIYFRKLNFKIIQVKTGKNFDESTFNSSEKFETENDSVRSLQLEKGDSLWIALGKKEKHIYSFSLQDVNYNQLLVQPNYGHIETWVEKPIYITDEDEIHSLYDGKFILKLTAPERMYPSLPMMPSNPRFKEDRYFSIDRESLFKLKK
ncbi:hypothetical protein [Zunongwangia endophytica]|uniref:Uncharacterized protein n=1 Tax=Zunongwangia endophytica TaxID=1808945 RepID=A0ABV8HBQ1_9FLAO|nr:hypothetical protein [Zunongwangia endophytica]MDN3594672.1 hypothetical protein [Zunongwangia endophytica]